MDAGTDTDTNMDDDNLTMTPTTGRRPTPAIRAVTYTSVRVVTYTSDRVVTYTSNADEIID